MENEVVIKLLFGAAAWITTNIVAFIVYVVRTNTKQANFQTAINLKYTEIRNRVMKVENELEKNRNEVNARLKQVGDELALRYEKYHDDNSKAHERILDEVTAMRDWVGEMRESLSYIKGRFLNGKDGK